MKPHELKNRDKTRAKKKGDNLLDYAKWIPIYWHIWCTEILLSA
jgi:hypothetical protein